MYFRHFSVVVVVVVSRRRRRRPLSVRPSRLPPVVVVRPLSVRPRLSKRCPRQPKIMW